MAMLFSFPLVSWALQDSAPEQPEALAEPPAYDLKGLDWRWENVEGAPWLAGGVRPRFSPLVGCHLVRLEPGAGVTVRVPGHAVLRVHCPDTPLEPTDVEVHASDGSGVKVPLAGVAAPGGRSWCFQPRALRPMLLEVKRPMARNSALRLGLFVARVDFESRRWGYRDVVPLPLAAVRISTSAWLPGEKWWLMEESRTATVELEGPARLALLTRLPYSPAESESVQGYRVRVAAAGRRWTFELDTAPDAAGAYHVGSGWETLGEERAAYLDLPGGHHQLGIESTARLYLRILASSPADLLLEAPIALPPELLQVPGAALSFARENRFAGGALLGAACARALAVAASTHPEDREAARTLHRRLARYRNLLPLDKTSLDEPLVGWFAVPRLLGPLEEGEDIRLDLARLGDALAGFSPGFFLRAPLDRESAHVYPLPPLAAPSQLRVLVEANVILSPVAIRVQLDEAPPLELMALPQPELPLSEYQPSHAEAAAAALAGKLEAGKALGVHAALSASRPPAPIVRVAAGEIRVEGNGRRARVWVEGVPAPRLALQLLVESPWELTEREFHDAVIAAVPAGGPAALRGAFQAWQRGEPLWETDLRDLARHWTLFFRGLEEARLRVHSSLRPRTAPSRAPARDLEAARSSAATAMAFEKAGDWLPALEAWSRTLETGDGVPAKRVELARMAKMAKLHRAEALLELGEEFLAETELRGMFLYEEDADLGREALERLIRIHEEAGDEESLREVLLAATAESTEPWLVRRLAENLAGAGRHAKALMVGLSLDPADWPLSVLLRSAYALRWWSLFDQLAERLEDAAVVSWWQGLREAARWEFEAALESFDGAGQLGAPWAASLRRSLEIRAALASADPEARERAVAGWESWQAEHPGPWTWTEDATLVVDFAGGEMVRNVVLDLQEDYYRATPERAVRLRLRGPAKLRIEARPLHPPGSTGALDGWVLLREKGILRPVAVNNNLPASGLVRVGSAGAVGTKVAAELALGPGFHEVDVQSATLDLLVRPLILRPEVSLGVLPPLTPATIGIARAPDPSGDRPVHRARVHLRPLDANEPERAFAVAPLHDARSGENLPAAGDPPAAAADLETREAAALAAGRLEAVLALPLPHDGPGVLRRMALLAYVAESAPHLRRAAVVQGEALFATHRRTAGLQTLHSRLAAATEWSQLDSVRDSAGLRYAETGGWQSENPDIRVRTAFLPPLAADERRLIGEDALLIVLRNVDQAWIEVVVTLETVGHLPLLPLAVLWRLDEGEQQRAALSPEMPGETLRLTVPAGEHSVRLRIESPLVNRYVRVLVREADAARIAAAEESAASRQRLYHLATAARPLRLRVEGPAWLRVDELRDGYTLARYRPVEAGWQDVELKPEGGRGEALFRVFERRHGRPDASRLPRRSAAPLAAVPLSPFRLEPEPPLDLVLSDVHRLGGQEDGTLSLSAVARRRRNFDEDDQDGAEQFLEVEAAHRLFAERLAAHFETGALLRAREEGGPTVGLREDIHCRPSWLPFNLHLTGKAHVQWPNGPMLLPTGPSEWSGTLRGSLSRLWWLGPKTYHMPSAAFFGRHLSLDTNDAYRAGRIDQDVFTTYKKQHRHGLVLSESFGYHPWLDTEWWGRVALTTNEQPLDPDHAAAEVGWRQFVAGWRVDVGYRTTRFFNDSDRSRAKNRDAINLGLQKDIWWAPGHRFEAGLDFHHDLSDGEQSGFAFLAWHFSGARAYRDFWPGDIDFLPLRAARVPPEHHDGMEAAHGQ